MVIARPVMTLPYREQLRAGDAEINEKHFSKPSLSSADLTHHFTFL